MKKRNETDALNEAIILLQEKRQKEFVLLKEQLHTVYESIKPVNILKRTFQEVTESPKLKNNFVNIAVGLTSGFLSKKLLLGSSLNPVKNLIGSILQFTVANVVSKHADDVKSAGENLLHRFFKSKKEAKNNTTTIG